MCLRFFNEIVTDSIFAFPKSCIWEIRLGCFELVRISLMASFANALYMYMCVFGICFV